MPIFLAAVFLGTGNCSSKLVHGIFFFLIPVLMFVKFKRNLYERYGDILDEVLMVRTIVKNWTILMSGRYL